MLTLCQVIFCAEFIERVNNSCSYDEIVHKPEDAHPRNVNHGASFLKAVAEFKHVQTEQLGLAAANNPRARLLVYTIGCGEMSNHFLVRLVDYC